MFNFHVVLAGHDKVTDTGRATKCRRKLETPSLQTKSTKTDISSVHQATTWKTRPLIETIDYDLCN